MKKILALILAAITIFMCSCDQALSYEGESETDLKTQDTSSHSEVLSDDPPFIKTTEEGKFMILPISKNEVELEEKYYEFIPYISEELLEKADKDIFDNLGQVKSSQYRVLAYSSGHLYMEVEYIENVDPERIANGYDQVPPCGNHWHLWRGGCITSQPLEKFIKKSTVSDDYISIKALADKIIATSKEPEEIVPDTNPDGSFNENIPGDLPPVNELPIADLTAVKGKYVDFLEKTDAIIVFYKRNDQSQEKCVIITSNVMMVLETGFGHPRQFSYLNNYAVNVISSAYIISSQDYRRCKAHKDVLDALKEIDPESVPPETDFSGDIFFGYMTEDSFEVYSKETLEKIFAEHGYEDNGLSAFEETFERFGVKNIVKP